MTRGDAQRRAWVTRRLNKAKCLLKGETYGFNEGPESSTQSSGDDLSEVWQRCLSQDGQEGSRNTPGQPSCPVKNWNRPNKNRVRRASLRALIPKLRSQIGDIIYLPGAQDLEGKYIARYAPDLLYRMVPVEYEYSLIPLVSKACYEHGITHKVRYGNIWEIALGCENTSAILADGFDSAHQVWKITEILKEIVSKHGPIYLAINLVNTCRLSDMKKNMEIQAHNYAQHAGPKVTNLPLPIQNLFFASLGICGIRDSDGRRLAFDNGRLWIYKDKLVVMNYYMTRVSFVENQNQIFIEAPKTQIFNIEPRKRRKCLQEFENAGIGARIREFRKTANWSQRELGIKVGYPESSAQIAISKLERSSDGYFQIPLCRQNQFLSIGFKG
jgi:hypothetical protein